MIRNLIILFCFCLLFFSCSDSKEKSSKPKEKPEKIGDEKKLRKYVLSYAHQLGGVSVFGKVNLNELVNKSDLKNLGKNDITVSFALSSYNRLNGLVCGLPLYFCANSNEDQNVFYAFAAVTNLKSTKKILEDYFDAEISKTGSLYVSYDEDMLIVLNEQFLVITKIEDVNVQMNSSFIKKHEELFLQSFDTEYYEKKLSRNEKDLLRSKSDIVFTYGLQQPVKSLIENLNVKSNPKTNALINDLNDCFNETEISFENGKMSVVSRNILSDTMNRWNVFKNDTKSIVNCLGKEDPFASFAINIDVSEIQKIYITYLDETVGELMSSIPPLIKPTFERIINHIDKKEINLSSNQNIANENTADAKMGISLYMNPGNIPNFNFYSNSGELIISTVEDYLFGFGDMFKSNSLNSMNNDEIIFRTSSDYVERKKGTSYSPYFNEYGSYPLNVFFNLTKIPWDTNASNPASKDLLSIFRNINSYVADNKFHVDIETIFPNENILKSLVKSLLKQDTKDLLTLRDDLNSMLNFLKSL